MWKPDLLRLRDLSPDQIIDQYGEQSRQFFNRSHEFSAPALAVLPARNEEDDIAAALASLGRSRFPTVAIVAVNGTTDNTAEVAQAMGAVVKECEPAKMRASQVGMAYAREHFPQQDKILFGDADNIFGHLWSMAMTLRTKHANERNGGRGAGVFGIGIEAQGGSLAVDALRTGDIMRAGIKARFLGGRTYTIGFNYALGLDPEGAIEAAYNSVDPKKFVGEERIFSAAIKAAGATISQCLDPRTVIITRGDRVRTREEYRRMKNLKYNRTPETYKDAVVSLYTRQYRDNDFQHSS